MKSAPFRIAVVSCVVFFLMFLGMRLSFLDKTSKPKPRPRAVLNLFAKSMSSSTLFQKATFAPSFDAFCGSQSTPEIHRPYVPVRYITLQTSPVVSPDVFLPKGRSPPAC
ncbi:MAG: hypothetical protein IPQ16_07070 [Geobacteraceae bacterium]|nr:hypothetical protein [Geobacteraceae bacterium]